MLDKIIDVYSTILHFVAEFTVHTLEIIGIGIIIYGAVKALVQAITRIKNKQDNSQNVIIALGRSLALALEFKMGAEIVNTVIIKDLRELVVLAIIIVLRAILALLIHWEIKNEQKDEAYELEKKTRTSSKDELAANDEENKESDIIHF